MNISSLLVGSTARRPEHPAIRFPERTITYAELNRQVDRLSHGLVRAGLRPRDTCVLMMPNSIDWAIAYYALAKVGAVVLPVNFLYRVGELDHIFKDSGARAFIGHKDHLEHPRQVMKSLPKMDLRIAQGLSDTLDTFNVLITTSQLVIAFFTVSVSYGVPLIIVTFSPSNFDGSLTIAVTSCPSCIAFFNITLTVRPVSPNNNIFIFLS